MGQSQGKESRNFEGSEGASGSRDRRLGDADASSRSRARMSRTDLSFLGLSSGSAGRSNERTEAPERRETRQEREARRQEKERAARAKERERSLREEHIDGGYLVTLGTYVGPEDFSKTVVRQLQVHFARALWTLLECTIAYTCDRSRESLRLSGGVSTTGRTIGPSISLSQLLVVSLFLRQMTSPIQTSFPDLHRPRRDQVRISKI